MNVTKKEMQDKLQSLGETAPSSWTKVQLSARLAELNAENQELTETIMTEREVVKTINRCKRKADLQQLLREHSLRFSPVTPWTSSRAESSGT